MRPSLTLREHALKALSVYGAVQEEQEAGLFEAVLPEPLAGCLDLPGGVWRFTFDPEVEAEEQETDLLVFGNSRLNRLLEYGRKQGVLAEGFVTGLYLNDPRIPTQIKRSVQVQGVELAIGSGQALNVRFVRFTFQASFRMDMQEEYLRCATVDLSTGALARQWETVLEQPGPVLAQHPAPACPEAAAMLLAKAYAVARAEILAQLAPVYAALQRDLAHRRREEARRITNFHDNYREELEALKARHQTHQTKRLAAIEAKILSSQKECQQRLEELSGKYSLSSSLRLCNLLAVIQPMVFTPCRIRHQGKELARLTVRWDPRERRVDPAPCPACGKPSLSFIVNPKAREHRVRCGCCHEKM